VFIQPCDKNQAVSCPGVLVESSIARFDFFLFGIYPKKNCKIQARNISGATQKCENKMQAGFFYGFLPKKFQKFISNL
jgi:hypothetical protein